MSRKRQHHRTTRKVSRKAKKGPHINKLFVLAFVLAASVMILAIGLTATTRATLKDSDSKTNNFSYGDLKAELEEEFTPPTELPIGKPYGKKVAVKNTGELDTFVRVLVLPEILTIPTGAEAPIMLPASLGKEVILLDELLQPISDSADWVDGQDGYFYYVKKLAVGQTTAPLFTNVQVLGTVIDTDPLYKKANFDLHVKVEGIHTTQWAYRDAWWNTKTPTTTPLSLIDGKLKGLTH